MMYFLGGLSDWLSSVGTNLMGAMEIGIRTLSFSLCTIIYNLIIKLYDVFDLLCKGRLLNNDVMESLSTRIGLILGLVMFFYIIFSMIQMLLEPDKMNDKEIGAGNIIKKIIIVIVMLGFSNFAFNGLYHVQKVVIESHALSNILLPYRIEQEGLDSFGKVLSNQLLLSFYELEDFDNEQLDTESKTTYEGCVNTVTSFNNQIINSGKFDLGYNCLNESVTVPENTGTGAGVVDREVFIINYNYIIAPLVGCVAVYMLFMYCFKIGIRMIQLAFLEIISPMAFVSYLAPKKDTMFSKWTKIYVSTYIDVFIRIVIINFVIFLLATIFANTTENGSFTFWETVGGRNSGSAPFIKVVIILALLTFAKKAPDLLKDLFGSGAPSKLGFGVAMKDIVGLKNTVGLAAGAAGGAAVGLLAGRPLGAVGGLLKGGMSGLRAKGVSSAFSGAWKAQSKANAEIAKVRANGGNWLGHQVAKTQQAVGARTRADYFDDEKATLEKENAIYKQVTGYFDSAKKRAEAKILEGNDDKFTTASGVNYGIKVRESKNMIDMLKEQASQLKPGDVAGLLKIQSQIESEQKKYNDNLLLATKEYFKAAGDPNVKGDVVVEQNIKLANGIIDNNKSLSGFVELSTITNFDTFQKADGNSHKSISANTVELSRNASEGKVPRANAGK